MNDDSIFDEVPRQEFTIDTEHYYEDCSPKKCKYCGCEDIKEIVTDTINYMACEIGLRCMACDERIGWWGYGNYEIDFALL